MTPDVKMAWMNGAGQGTWGNDVTLSSAVLLLGVRVHLVKVAEVEVTKEPYKVSLVTLKEPDIRPRNGVIHLIALGERHYQYLSASQLGAELCCPTCRPPGQVEQYAYREA